MHTLWQDIRYGARMLAQSPGFTAVAVLSLALGIGVNTAIFSVVNAFLFRPLPVDNPKSLVVMFSTSGGSGFFNEAPSMAYPDYEDFRDQTDAFEGMLAYEVEGFAVEQDGRSRFAMGQKVSGDYFATLRVKAAIGRFFNAEEVAEPGAGAYIVLGHAAWVAQYGADPGVLGRTIRLNGIPFAVVGVAPESFKGLMKAIVPDFWIPMTMHATLRPNNPGRLQSRGSRWATIAGRLKPGITLDEARAQLETVAARLAEQYPETNRNRGVTAYPSTEVAFFPGVDKFLYITSAVLMALVGMVLLIACANVANMLLARASGRRREIAIRLALGAKRWQIVRQLMIENFQLALLSSAAALVLAFWSNRLLNSPDLPLPLDIRFDFGLTLDGRVLGFTVAAAVLTTIFAGLIPALQATRPDLVPALKDEAGRGGGSRSGRWMRNTLVVSQVGLSLVLLIVAGLSVRSLMNANRVDPGFDSSNVVIAPFAVELRGYDAVRGKAFYRQLTENVAAKPGVNSVASALHLPLTFEIRTTFAAAQGQEGPDPKKWPETGTTNISPGYFATMGIPLLSGRGFTANDDENAPPVVIVNDTIANQFWPGENPLGKKILLNRSGDSHEVIGVARTHKYRTLGESPRPYVYQSLAANYEGMQRLIVKTSGDTAGAIRAIRAEADALDPQVPTLGIKTLAELNETVLILPRMIAGVFGLFGLLGLVLASVGLYGVLAYVVSQRTHEMGIRIALGASSRNILSMILRQGLGMTLVGIGVGLTAAWGVTRFLSSILYGITATDLLTFVGVPCLLGAVAALACLVPARRATRVDPMVALRYE